MNEHFENDGAKETDYYLRDLPELAAPPGLIARTMNAIEQPARTPWHLRPWMTWPAAARIASFTVSLCALAALVLAWNALLPAFVRAVHPFLARGRAEAAFLRDAAGALATAILLAVEHLGNGFVLGLGLFALLSYCVCVGMGALIIRFALIKPNKGTL